jgi:hypothetical protein
VSDIPKPKKPTDEIAALKEAVSREIGKEIPASNSVRMVDLCERIHLAIDQYRCNDRCADAIAWRLNSRGLSQVLDKAIDRLKHARKQRDEARAEAMRLRGELELAMKINRAIDRPISTPVEIVDDASLDKWLSSADLQPGALHAQYCTCRYCAARVK